MARKLPSIEFYLEGPGGTEFVFQADYTASRGRSATFNSPAEPAEVEWLSVRHIGGLAGKETLRVHDPDKFEKIARRLERNPEWELNDLAADALEQEADREEAAADFAAECARDERSEREYA